MTSLLLANSSDEEDDLFASEPLAPKKTSSLLFGDESEDDDPFLVPIEKKKAPIPAFSDSDSDSSDNQGFTANKKPHSATESHNPITDASKDAESTDTEAEEDEKDEAEDEDKDEIEDDALAVLGIKTPNHGINGLENLSDDELDDDNPFGADDGLDMFKKTDNSAAKATDDDNNNGSHEGKSSNISENDTTSDTILQDSKFVDPLQEKQEEEEETDSSNAEDDNSTENNLFPKSPSATSVSSKPPVRSPSAHPDTCKCLLCVQEKEESQMVEDEIEDTLEREPFCPNDHQMVLTTYSGGAYKKGWYCDDCAPARNRKARAGPRYWCETCGIDYCENCAQKYARTIDPAINEEVIQDTETEHILSNQEEEAPEPPVPEKPVAKDESLIKLVAMGFSEENARSALQGNDNAFEPALETLLSTSTSTEKDECEKPSTVHATVDKIATQDEEKNPDDEANNLSEKESLHEAVSELPAPTLATPQAIIQGTETSDEEEEKLEQAITPLASKNMKDAQLARLMMEADELLSQSFSSRKKLDPTPALEAFDPGKFDAEAVGNDLASRTAALRAKSAALLQQLNAAC
eukprot:m.205259 g.205259  ORF g.205259 m.205259 type:complete len:580 (-) comp15783_c0_seq2:1315-3054(-)